MISRLLSHRRVGLLAAYAKGNRNQVSMARLLHEVLRPGMAARARDYIERIVPQGDHNLFYIKGVADPIHWPKQLAERELFQIINELMDPESWHYYEIPETSLNPDDVVVDCGTAEGLFTLKAARKCKFVYAVEPAPSWMKPLKLATQSLDNVQILPVALGAKKGEAFMTDSGIDSRVSASGTGFSIEVSTLDDLFACRGIRITYLKADLEGFELEMLAGATETIKTYKPKIAITTYHHRDHARQVQEILKGLVPEYHFKTKGIMPFSGIPEMLHAWA